MPTTTTTATVEIKKGFNVRMKGGEPIRVFKPGKAELTEEELEHWFIKARIKAGLITLVSDDAQPAGDDDTGPTEKELKAKMLAVFPRLTDDDMKKDGSPTVKAVEAALGVDVSADQVAAAWAEYQAAQNTGSEG